MSDNTQDLSKFGYRELDIAADLLKAYTHAGAPDFLTDGITVEFNPNSGFVFLVDSDLNVGVLDDDNNLVQFFTCYECGEEGTEQHFSSDENHRIDENNIIHLNDRGEEV